LYVLIYFYLKRNQHNTYSLSRFHSLFRSRLGSTEEEAKERLINLIDNFIKERIVWADKAIAEYGVTKINDGDVILTYAR